MAPERPMAAIESFPESDRLVSWECPALRSWIWTWRVRAKQAVGIRRHQLEPVSLKPARPLMQVAAFRTFSGRRHQSAPRLSCSPSLAAETLHSHFLRNIVAVPNVVDQVPLAFVAVEGARFL